MATNLSDFVDEIRPTTPSCPGVTMKKAVRQAVQEFCRRTNLLKYSFEYSVLTTDVTAADNDSVDVDMSTLFPNYRPIKVLQFKQDDLEYTPEYLQVGSDLADFSDNYDISNKKYYNISDSQIVKFFPFDISDTVTLFLEVVFNPLDSVTTVADCLYDDWLDVIVDGALWRLLNMPNKPWTDKREALTRRRFFNNGIGRASIKQKRVENDRGRVTRMPMDF